MQMFPLVRKRKVTGVKMRVSRAIVLGLILLWCGVVMIVLKSPDQENDNRRMQAMEEHLRAAIRNQESFNSQIRASQEMIGDMREKQRIGSVLLKKCEYRMKAARGPFKSVSLSAARETTRRKVEQTATHLRLFLEAQLKKLKSHEAGSTVEDIKAKVSRISTQLSSYFTVLESDLGALRRVDGDEEKRRWESARLGDLVQRRLHYLQNPNSCTETRVAVCRLEKECGLACQLHHVAYCLLVAYNTGRTLLLDSSRWRYHPGGWEAVFQPLAPTCSPLVKVNWTDVRPQEFFENIRVARIGFVEANHEFNLKFMPLAIPEDLALRLTSFHGNPAAWWMGQLLRYLFKPKPAVLAKLAKLFPRPVVGLHVRRSDKLIAEASFHPLSEYMLHAERYFEQLEHRLPNVTRVIYLATDDFRVIQEARIQYGHYKIIISEGAAKSARWRGSLTSNHALLGIVKDVELLSQTDHLVCTFSSQVCRLAYELMQTKHGDASSYFTSLDDIYYYGGMNPHYVRAVEPNQGNQGLGETDAENEMVLEIGDLIQIEGDHWDGFSRGRNSRTQEVGLFPSHKVVDDPVLVRMPTYPEVKGLDSEIG